MLRNGRFFVSADISVNGGGSGFVRSPGDHRGCIGCGGEVGHVVDDLRPRLLFVIVLFAEEKTPNVQHFPFECFDVRREDRDIFQGFFRFITGGRLG